MKFIERTSAPSTTNKYYLKAGKGGYNRAMEINSKTHSCLPNCPGLVHGRWLESQNQTNYSKYDKLCTGNAKSYWGYTKDGYKRGQTPKVGAVGCCSGGSKGYGHVFFIEKVYGNGDILTSNSGYDGSRFFTKRLYKSNGYSFGKKYKLQGFIYNPCNFDGQYNLTRILKLKYKGSDVKELQRELVKRGYSVGKCGVDGVFGDDTYKAVKKFQKASKITADGVVGKNTAHKLGWLFKGK